MNRVYRLGSESTSRLLAEFSLPAIIAMVSQSVCSIIDKIYTGNGAGSMAISGITVSFPVIAVFMAFGMLIGIGGSSLYSIKIGEGSKHESESILLHSFMLLALVSVLLSLVTAMFLPHILGLFGAGGEPLEYAVHYLGVLLFALPVQAVGFGLNNFIRAEGRPAIAMTTVLIAATGSVLLAPLFIFYFKMGIQGAALSTLAAQSLACAWVIGYFVSTGRAGLLRRIRIIPDMELLRQITCSGLGPFSMQICAVAVSGMFNHQLARYGGDLSLSVFGIVHSISVFILMPAIGMNQGAQPLMGFNHGAGRSDRARMIFFKAVITSTIIILCGTFAVQMVPGFFTGLFNHGDIALRTEGEYAIKYFMAMLPLAGLQICASGYFVATGKPLQSVMITLSRQVFFLLPSLILLPLFFGIRGVWLAAPLSDFAAFLLAALLLYNDMKKNVAAPSLSVLAGKPILSGAGSGSSPA